MSNLHVHVASNLKRCESDLMSLSKQRPRIIRSKSDVSFDKSKQVEQGNYHAIWCDVRDLEIETSFPIKMRSSRKILEGIQKLIANVLPDKTPKLPLEFNFRERFLWGRPLTWYCIISAQKEHPIFPSPSSIPCLICIGGRGRPPLSQSYTLSCQKSPLQTHGTVQEYTLS